MRASPSAELVDLLTRLKLATPGQLRAAYRPARRLAKDLALFDSVWVDALVQTRVLTPYQAKQINCGLGDDLRVGPFVLVAPLPRTTAGHCYRARDVLSGRIVRLIVLEPVDNPTGVLARIEDLIKTHAAIQSPHLARIERCGRAGERIWIASADTSGRTAKDWLVRGGRMPAGVVLEIARQMAATLTICEAAGLIHGDISIEQLVLDPLGLVLLLDGGLPSLLHPVEHRAVENRDGEQLSPAVVDYLSPERAAGGIAPTATSDIFACGALWWHLLAGRAPFSGATVADRRRAACSTRIRDIHPIAPDAPRRLVEAIASATEPAPDRRPPSFAALLDLLGPPSDRGQARVARYAARGASPPERLIRHIRTIRRSPNLPTWATAVAGVMLALAIGSWPLWTSLLVEDAPVQPRPASQVATAPRPENTPNQKASGARDGVAPRPKTFADTGDVTPVPELAPSEPAPVVRTSVTQPVPSGPTGTRQAVSREFVLSAARPVPWSQVRPMPGQVVRSREGERAKILLPANGAMLTTENVRFEDVDFVIEQPSATTTAMLGVAARTSSFLRCSMQVVAESGRPPAAITWRPSDGTEAAQVAAPRLTLRECVLSGVGDCVRCAAPTVATIELADTLFLGASALVAIEASSDVAQAISVKLEHCTVRGGAGVVEWQPPRDLSSGDRLTVVANACVFDLDVGGAVLIVDGGKPSAELFQAIAWQGAGSILAPRIPLVRCRQPDGTLRPPTERRMEIEGLVRSEMGFAGDRAEGPDASRLVRWKVPLRSATPPGIGDMSLPLPKLR